MTSLLSEPDVDLLACLRIWETLLPFCSPHVWMSPGNRSSPLVQTLFKAERQGLCTVHTHFDERGMAFAALGSARASDLPVLLLCTSGSAVANLLPALVEARAQGLCLVVLSADRPIEEVERGCPQTWPHLPLLQGAVVKSWSLPLLPESYPASLEMITQALQQARGPLHLNIPCREPFGIDRGNLPALQEARVTLSTPSSWLRLPPALDEAWCGARRPLITLGALWKGASEELIALLQSRGALVLADGLSQNAFQEIAIRLTEEAVCRLEEGPSADLWIHLGGPLLSRSFTRLMARWAPLAWVIHEHDLWWDPADLQPARCLHSPLHIELSAWKARPPASLAAIWPCSEPFKIDPSPPEEALPILQAFQTTPAEGIFFVGNSLPIRHLVEYAPQRSNPPRIWANRGVNGIDGNLATALGMAASQPLPMTLALGDLTALHDLNSLALGHEAIVPPRLLVVNNGGGGIFQKICPEMPPDTLRRGFLTPHRWSFEGAARQFNWIYSAAAKPPEQPDAPLLWEPPVHRL